MNRGLTVPLRQTLLLLLVQLWKCEKSSVKLDDYQKSFHILSHIKWREKNNNYCHCALILNMIWFCLHVNFSSTSVKACVCCVPSRDKSEPNRIILEKKWCGVHMCVLASTWMCCYCVESFARWRCLSVIHVLLWTISVLYSMTTILACFWTCACLYADLQPYYNTPSSAG